MLFLQQLTVFLATIVGLIGKACRHLFYIACTDCALTAAMIITIFRACFQVILRLSRLPVWIVHFVTSLVTSLLKCSPALLMAAFPTPARMQAYPVPDTLDNTLRQVAGVRHGTANLMEFLIAKKYPTAPLKFCIWYRDFSARTVSNEYGFPIWTPAEQLDAEGIFSPGSEEHQVLLHVLEHRMKISPWEARSQPTASVLSSSCQDESYAVTDHAFKTYGLSNPVHRWSGNPHAKELQVVIATFFADGGSLKLAMLENSKISALLIALQITSHHTVFQAIYEECYTFTNQKFRMFRYDSTLAAVMERRRTRSARNFTLFNGIAAFLLNIPLVLYHASQPVLCIPALVQFACVVAVLYISKKLSGPVIGSCQRNLRSWEAFLPTNEYINRRKKASLFVGIARKESLTSHPWSPEIITRVFLWESLCLALGEILENTFEDFFALLFNDDVVRALHDYLHKNFAKEVWIEKPSICRYHDIVLYSAAVYSFLLTSPFTAFFMCWRSTLA